MRAFFLLARRCRCRRPKNYWRGFELDNMKYISIDNFSFNDFFFRRRLLIFSQDWFYNALLILCSRVSHRLDSLFLCLELGIKIISKYLWTSAIQCESDKFEFEYSQAQLWKKVRHRLCFCLRNLYSREKCLERTCTITDKSLYI